LSLLIGTVFDVEIAAENVVEKKNVVETKNEKKNKYSCIFFDDGSFVTIKGAYESWIKNPDNQNNYGKRERVFDLDMESKDQIPEEKKKELAYQFVKRRRFFDSTDLNSNEPKVVSPSKIENPYLKKSPPGKYPSTKADDKGDENLKNQVESLKQVLKKKASTRSENKCHLRIDICKWFPKDCESSPYFTTLCVVFIRFISDCVGAAHKPGPRFGWNAEKIVETINEAEREHPGIYLPELLNFRSGMSKNPSAEHEDYNNGWTIYFKNAEGEEYGLDIPVLYTYMPIEWSTDEISAEIKRLLLNFSHPLRQSIYQITMSEKFKNTLEPTNIKKGPEKTGFKSSGDFWRSLYFHLNHMKVRETACLAQLITDNHIKQIVEDLFGLTEDVQNWPETILNFAYEKTQELEWS